MVESGRGAHHVEQLLHVRVARPVDTPVAPLGWHAEFDLTSVKFNNQGPQKTNVARVGPRYAFNPQLRLEANVGYEDNRYPLSNYEGGIYGVGIEWRPSERTG